MIIFSLLISFTAVLIELFTRSRGVILISYGLINPLFIFLPRIIYFFDSKVRKVVKIEWVKKIEFFTFFVLLFNAPASLILHDMGFQYDRFLHFSLAFLSFIIVLLFWLPVMRVRNKEINKRLLILFFLILIIGFFLWEGIQYSTDQIFGTKLFFDEVQEIRIDFWEDIFFGTCGLILSVIYIKSSFKKFLSVLR